MSGSIYVGGIAGHTTDSKITACYNTGAVSGSIEYVGGVAGYINGNSSSSYLTSCYNVGTVTGSESVGALIGLSSGDYDPIVEECYYITTIANNGYGTSLSSLSGLNDKVDDMNTAANTALETTGVSYYTVDNSGNNYLPSLMGELNVYVEPVDNVENFEDGGTLTNKSDSVSSIDIE